MKDFLSFLKDNNLTNAFIIMIQIFMITLAVVYIPGRMLEVVKSFRVKNFIATVAAVGFTYLNLKGFRYSIENIYQEIYFIAFHSSLVIVAYVLFGMRLFDRVDTKLDSLGFKDSGFKEDKKKK